MTAGLTVGVVVVAGLVVMRRVAGVARSLPPRRGRLATLGIEPAPTGSLPAARAVALRRMAQRGGAFVVWARPVVAGAVLVSVAIGNVVPIAVVGVALAACEAAAWSGRARTRRRLDEAMPRFADGIARSLRSGASLNTAVWDSAESVGEPIEPGLDRVRRRVGAGDTLVGAMSDWSATLDSRDLRTVVTVCAIGAQVGGRMAQAFDGCAASMRNRREVEAEMKAMASQARASAVMLTVLPFVVATFMSLLDPRVAEFLVGTPAGILCLAGTIALDAVAMVWMRSIVRSVW